MRVPALAARAPARGPQARAARLPAFTLARLGAPLLDAREADTFLARLFGLLALPRLGELDALVIRPCSAVHTFGMDYPIDVAFVDRDGTILKLASLGPRRGATCRGAHAAIELAAGTAARLSLAPGQRLVALEPGARAGARS